MLTLKNFSLKILINTYNLHLLLQLFVLEGSMSIRSSCSSIQNFYIENSLFDLFLAVWDTPDNNNGTLSFDFLHQN